MRLPYVVLVGLCIAHGVHSQGFLGSVVGSATNAIGSILGGGGGDGGGSNDYNGPCSKDPFQDYKKAQDEFYKSLYARVAARNNNHFVFSPYSIWLSLSALAEGADPSVQDELFDELDLPQDNCLRAQYYEIALNVEQSDRDVNFQRRRSLVLDEGLKVSPYWSEHMRRSGLLDVSRAPIKSNPAATSKQLGQYLGTRSKIVVRGNSVLLDSLDYQGLWTTAFAESGIRRAPFHNDLGQQIGTVDMMTMKKRVRLATLPFMSTKVLELPVGAHGRYTMLIAVGTGSNILKDAMSMFLGSVFQIFSALQMSLVPVNIAVPRFQMSSEFDVKPAIDDIGIHQFWKDPAATNLVSHPAAMPGGLIQRVSVRLDSDGVNPPPSGSDGIISGLFDMASNAASDVASTVGYNFVADRPFMYALFDTKTHTCIFAGAYSRPTYV